MQGTAEKRTGWRRARILPCALFILLLLTSGPSAQTGPGYTTRKKERLVGAWNQRGLTYTFEDATTLNVTRLDGGPGGYIRGQYTWFTLGIHDCISFRKDPADSLSLQVVLIGEVTDSTAVLALGAPFVRSVPGRGLQGTWNHTENLTRIEWSFGSDTVEYRKTVFDFATGREAVVEEYRGVWKRAEGRYEPGSCEVTFGESGQSIVLPLVYRDMMYLFDLSPGKSLFIRGKAKPPAGARLTRNLPRAE